MLIKGSNAEGILDIKTALDHNPNNQIAELGQGLAMLLSGQNDRALVALNQVVGKSPDFDGLARVLRARVLLAKNDTANALVDLNTVLGSRPNDSAALQTRSLVWLAMHAYDNALDDLNKAIALHESVEVYFARAKLYETQNKLDKAADDYRRATQLPAVTAFDVLAQAAAKQKTQQFSKRVPCVNSTGAGTCL